MVCILTCGSMNAGDTDTDSRFIKNLNNTDFVQIAFTCVCLIYMIVTIPLIHWLLSYSVGVNCIYLCLLDLHACSLIQESRERNKMNSTSSTNMIGM